MLLADNNCNHSLLYHVLYIKAGNTSVWYSNCIQKFNIYFFGYKKSNECIELALKDNSSDFKCNADFEYDMENKIIPLNALMLVLLPQVGYFNSFYIHICSDLKIVIKINT
jgi:hypothetical protein